MVIKHVRIALDVASNVIKINERKFIKVISKIIFVSTVIIIAGKWDWGHYLMSGYWDFGGYLL
ncbi:hypothetical protein P886_1219 [Alteromonadaceae bacterium 2753L.S.0a.02]|nr:hypothetical protein P886_1219 [Alteromonadaceae bacterium 2753L.S.0a.02]